MDLTPFTLLRPITWHRGGGGDSGLLWFVTRTSSRCSRQYRGNHMSQKKRCVVVMYDTLCRHFMPTYGNEWIKAPNFQRLAARSIQFNNFYVGSMPCMPARREMHTGRYNFLHRSWGPLEPFDDSMPEILNANGVHSHKVTDHHHYWEDGGATYHQRYTTFDLVRGQEGDKWKGDVEVTRTSSRCSRQYRGNHMSPWSGSRHPTFSGWRRAASSSIIFMLAHAVYAGAPGNA